MGRERLVQQGYAQLHDRQWLRYWVYRRRFSRKLRIVLRIPPSGNKATSVTIHHA